MNKVKETEEELKRMEHQLKSAVDINYGRYNNEYMDIAAEHMWHLKKQKEKKVDYRFNDANEESADRLFNKLRGTIIV